MQKTADFFDGNLAQKIIKTSKKNTKNDLVLKEIKPKTKNQNLVFEYYNQNKNLLLHGLPGTGKTFLAFYMALMDLSNPFTKVEKIFIVRSAVPARDMGFMPGDLEMKMSYYEDPYHRICSELFQRDDAYEVLKKTGKLEFLSTSFNRGMTYENGVIIIDEIQNMALSEIDTTMTRIGKNCRLIVCGDYRQTDLNKECEKKGLTIFLEALDKMPSFTRIEFEVDDIVRSKIVKEYILARNLQ